MSSEENVGVPSNDRYVMRWYGERWICERDEEKRKTLLRDLILRNLQIYGRSASRALISGVISIFHTHEYVTSAGFFGSGKPPPQVYDFIFYDFSSNVIVRFLYQQNRCFPK